MKRLGCRDVERHVLEASPAALTALPGEVRDHLEGCLACRARVARAADALEELGRALHESRPTVDAGEAVILARSGRSASRRPARVRSAPRALRWAPVPVALAMGLWLAVSPESPVSSEPPALARPGTPDPAVGFAVESTESGPFAVFQTRDPRIRVVWFYDAESLSHQTGAIDR